jgi:hypothetical protein
MKTRMEFSLQAVEFGSLKAELHTRFPSPNIRRASLKDQA